MVFLKKLVPVFLLMTLTLFETAEIVRGQKTPLPVNTYTQSVAREVLASGCPENAEGELLELVRICIS